MSFGDFIFSTGLFQKREKGGLNCIKRTKLVCDEALDSGRHQKAPERSGAPKGSRGG
jgi:hypothetical protein